MKTGTCHFISREAALKYYRPYNSTDNAKEVDRKIKDGEIAIGPLELKTGESLSTIPDEGRYAITTKD